ncbi:hypothetical protein AB0K16_19335 [Nonomuraea jabiensis]|uniref:hypothetical protein n=1 Tax=Nonomuraea jabiensis TaxID=882448 RepID=UPI0034380C3F
MKILLGDLEFAAELSDDALEAVIGGREPMTPATPKVCTAMGNGTISDACFDMSGT